MIEAAVIILRLLQYAGAAVLFGSSLFFLYALPATGPGSASATPWTRPLVAGSALVLALSALLAVGAQASLFTGSFVDGFTTDSMGAVVSSMSLGKAAVLRGAVAALAAGCLISRKPDRSSWLVTAGLGALAAASLAWMGHAAASANWVQLTADVLHALAAALWIGALVAFVLLLNDAREAIALTRLHTALRQFSTLGVPLVLILTLSGLVNGWFLIGPSRLGDMPFTPYGRLLHVKLAAFAVMLLLAMINRYRHTPALESRPDAVTVASLRKSIACEAALGLSVLALVAWLGTLEPPRSLL